MELTVESLLKRLKDESAVELLEAYDHPEYAALWNAGPQGPQLYRGFAKALIQQGYPTTGLNLARRGLHKDLHPTDPHLRYLVALAYARGGSTSSAESVLGPLLSEALAAAPGAMPDGLRVDVVALRGRLFKDHYRREPDPARKADFARQSAEWYLKAADLPGAGSFPLLNAATMRLLHGQAEEARELAGRTLERAEAEKAAGGTGYWLPATTGEACALLGRHAEAVEQLERAVEQMIGSDLGALASLLANLRLLADAGVTENPVRLQRKFGSVVAFSGHRIDPPERAARRLPPRFPPVRMLENRVRKAIHERLEAVNARFGFCSLASGADILFAEEMLARPRSDLQVVLPFAKPDFLRTSVDYGDPELQDWASAFRAILRRLRPDQVHYATSEPYLGSEELFAYANGYLQGMAAVRAGQCGITPLAVAVLDPDSDARVGGTRHFVESWRRLGYPDAVIDLAELREGVPVPKPAEAAARPAEPPPELPRPIRAMLFADVAGFSQMREEFHPRFFGRFSADIAEEVKAAGDRVLLANTWGDGFFAVFETVTDCARFALALLGRMRHGLDWVGMGFANPNPLRVGLHAGPVFEMERDPALGRRNFFGQHVNRTARIEPVTMPGCAYASEQFAALLTVEARDEFVCEFVGTEELPKKAGCVVLYRVQAASGR